MNSTGQYPGGPNDRSHGANKPTRKKGALIAGGGAVAILALGVLGNAVGGDDEPTPVANTSVVATTTSSTSKATTTTRPTTATRATTTTSVAPSAAQSSTPSAPTTTTPYIAPVPVYTPPPTTYTPPPIYTPEPVYTPPPAAEVPSKVYYKNCAAARAAGAAPVYIGEPGYGTHLDRDKDGIGCE
ncbi:excalibur calcium-binding domain-containing protein [Rhodococcus rhodochrous]|uniref:excalibur calcium-binding domain-containing protein n=1 Tax=Rhodococcus rhodochrous TaxID=1829 RepID=UPI000E737ED9